MKINRAIVLAAGLGTRLRPLTNDRPKCLVDLYGKSLLEQNIETLRKAGIKEIIVVGGYKFEKQKGIANIKLIFNNEFETTNMVWSLNEAANFLNEETILTYGDIVYSPKILVNLINNKADIAIAVDMNWKTYWNDRLEDPITDLESLRFKKGTNFIEDIGEKQIKFQKLKHNILVL